MKKFPLSLALFATIALAFTHSNAYGCDEKKNSKQEEKKNSKQEEKYTENCGGSIRYTDTHLSPSERRGLRREQRRLERQVRREERRGDRLANREFRQNRRAERRADRFDRRMDRKIGRMERRADRQANRMNRKLGRMESKLSKYSKYSKYSRPGKEGGKTSKQEEKENGRYTREEESGLPSGWRKVSGTNSENNSENKGNEKGKENGTPNGENKEKKETKPNPENPEKEKETKPNPENPKKEKECECEGKTGGVKEKQRSHCKHRTGVGHALAWIGHGFRDPDRVGEQRKTKNQKVITNEKIEKTHDLKPAVDAQIKQANATTELGNDGIEPVKSRDGG